MSNTAKRDNYEMRYLLGDLSEDEKTRMEEAYFADDARFEELELAEEELIDAFVRERLSPDDERRFRARLRQSPRLVERVNFARVLAEKADTVVLPSDAKDLVEPAALPAPAPRPKPRWWEGFFQLPPAFRAALASCVVLVILSGLGLLYGWLRLRSESEQLAAERAALQRQKEQFDKLSTDQSARLEQLDADLQRAREQQAQDQQRISELELAQGRESEQSVLRPVFALLRPGVLRSEGAGNEVRIGPQTSAAKLTLQLVQSDYSNYRVAVENVDDGRTVTVRNLEAQNTRAGPQLSLQIPARRLPPGDYTIRVSGRSASGGFESVADYSFRVKNSTP